MLPRNAVLYVDSRVAPATSARPETCESEATTARLYRVQAGDTLRGIAKTFYGREDFWRALYEANAGVLGAPDPLSPGMILFLPGL